MNPRLPALTARQVLQKLRRAGFVFDRQQTGMSIDQFREL